jgi:N-methylhydantoinase B/oxoprolinase/acetone carboxylase alpha subunit
MKQKLDTLFNYVSESRSIQLFKEHFEEYTEMSTYLKELTDEYNELYFNEERALKLEKKVGDIFKIQERVNELFQKYREKENPSILQHAMLIYKDELRPEIANLRLLKYSLCEMVDEGVDKKLIQHTIPVEKRDFTFGSYPKVIQFSKN